MSVLKDTFLTLLASAGLGAVALLALARLVHSPLDGHQRPVFLAGVIAFAVVVRGLMGVRQGK